MERNLLKPFIAVAALMTLSVFALAFTTNVKFNYTPGVKMRLPKKLGNWKGNELRFCHNLNACAKDYADASFYTSEVEIPDICPNCGEKLYKMSYAEWDALPKDTEFIKSVYTNATGGRVFVSVVMSGKARNSIHRPQRCLKGQGNAINNEYTLPVPLDGRSPLKMRVLEASRMMRMNGKEVSYDSYYAYCFVGQDRETPYHLERMFWLGWDRVVRSVSHRWAYIAFSGKRDPNNDDYQKDIITFVAKMYPLILSDTFKAN